jgi:hypothetical protein
MKKSGEVKLQRNSIPQKFAISSRCVLLGLDLDLPIPIHTNKKARRHHH